MWVKGRSFMGPASQNDKYHEGNFASIRQSRRTQPTVRSAASGPAALSVDQLECYGLEKRRSFGKKTPISNAKEGSIKIGEWICC